jgi:hypothetical protein
MNATLFLWVSVYLEKFLANLFSQLYPSVYYCMSCCYWVFSRWTWPPSWAWKPNNVGLLRADNFFPSQVQTVSRVSSASCCLCVPALMCCLFAFFPLLQLHKFFFIFTLESTRWLCFSSVHRTIGSDVYLWHVVRFAAQRIVVKTKLPVRDEKGWTATRQ